MSHCIHKSIRNHVCRGVWKNRQRPVLINNWEATYFDFTGDKLVEIAKDAFDMGIELFVMDDGWFGKRDDDNSGLGDWYPNEKKLGCKNCRYRNGYVCNICWKKVYKEFYEGKEKKNGK